MMQWSYDTLLKWGTDELTAHDVENGICWSIFTGSVEWIF